MGLPIEARPFAHPSPEFEWGIFPGSGEWTVMPSAVQLLLTHPYRAEKFVSDPYGRLLQGQRRFPTGSK